MQVHVNVYHLKRRDFRCPREECKMAFGYKHKLQQHVAKYHTPVSDDGLSPRTDVSDANTARGKTVGIDFLTGKKYQDNARDLLDAQKVINCPCPDWPSSFISHEGSETGDEQAASEATNDHCEFVFTRAYDLRRHLLAIHDLDVDKEVVHEWVKMTKGHKHSGN